MGVAAVLLVGAVVAVLVADDQGSATVGVLAIIASGGLAYLLAPPDVLRRLLHHGGDNRRDLRQDALDRVESALARQAERLRPAAVRIALPVERRRRRAGPVSGYSSTEILGFYDSSHGRMALTGDPGSGKTCTSIELGLALLERARADIDGRIPAFLRLTQWNGAHRLEDWLIDRIAAETALGKPAVTRIFPLFVPILDGLDEVAESDRDACARVIEQYAQANPSAALVVTCRLKEYRRLPLAGSATLPVYHLRPLSVADLDAFLTAARPDGWRSVIQHLRAEPDGSLAAALNTPLMVTVALDGWDDTDPADLVTQVRDGSLDEATTRALLWESWLNRKSAALNPAHRDGAAALARAATATGAAEIRIERLGSTATRWIWFLGMAVTVAALTVNLPPNLAFFPFAGSLWRAADRTLNKLSRGWRRFGNVAFVGLLASFATLPYVINVAPSPLLSTCISVTCAVLSAVTVAETTPPAAARRLTNKPFRLVQMSVLLASVSGFGAALVLLVVLVVWTPPWGWDSSFALIVLEEGWPLAAMAGLIAADLAGLGFVGPHILARAWHRVVRGAPIKKIVSALVAADLLRFTGDGYRFFHLECQAFLATRTSPIRISLDNIGTVALWGDAVSAGRRQDYELALKLWERVLQLEPQNADAHFNRGLTFLRMRRGEEALNSFQCAVRATPRFARAMAYCGETTRLLGLFDDAASHLEASLEIEPENAWTLATLGQVRAEQNELVDGLALLDRALELDSQMDWARDERTRVQALLRRQRQDTMSDVDAELDSPDDTDEPR